jgi:hypothetical protein
MRGHGDLTEYGFAGIPPLQVRIGAMREWDVEQQSGATDVPRAPVWTRLLGLRVLVVVFVVGSLVATVSDWIEANNGLTVVSRWIVQERLPLAVISFTSLLFSAAFALYDLVVCWIPFGRLRSILLLGVEETFGRRSLASWPGFVWKLLAFSLFSPLLLSAVLIVLMTLGGPVPAGSGSVVSPTPAHVLPLAAQR